MNFRPALIASIVPLMLLASCGNGTDGPAPAGEMDPATQAALNDPIMVDPDLAGQNDANAALTGGGNGSLPAEATSPAAIRGAREDAMALVGGSVYLKPAPTATIVQGEIPETAVLTAASRAAALPGGSDCTTAAEYSAVWAARLPLTFPVYPRGSTQEAAGTDKGQCSLRVVNFLTPVPLEEVLSFYYSRALNDGYTAEHLKVAGDNVLSGTKGRSAFVIYARKLANGLTDVDLVTSGN
ncbi:hypothetical protein [Allopontixanthobacter sp.]|uniref:hypothetical protein n=1 Tax=Allopontixanthobacter sp. TaxID=2906452 RepID=UPI002AB955A5|nr:hypothetical protein [Allopontixanthobacter sp.]MDZ4306602.1 hypothetical protein [Allopontixanthobacter sp.]